MLTLTWGVSAKSDQDDADPFPEHTGLVARPQHKPRVDSVYILCASGVGDYDVCERELLTPNKDGEIMKDAARYVRYAQIIYDDLKQLVVDEFLAGNEGAHFKRDAESLFRNEFRLTNVGCDSAMLSYASFVNDLAATPYCIMVDDVMQKIVVSVRGTMSIDDMVVDIQYNPISMEKTGDVCGFDGKGHFCHKGLLTRAKWLFNDIKK